MAYQLQVLTWQNTKDAQRTNPQHTPKPVEAPWEVKDKRVVQETFKTAASPDFLRLMNAPLVDITGDEAVLKDK